MKAVKPHCNWITVFLEDFLLNKLDERRHMAQHEAEPIASEHLPEYQVHTKDFLEVCFLKEFEVKFDELDLADAISDPKFCKLLKLTSQLIESGKYKLAVMVSKKVHSIASECFETHLWRLDSIHFEDEVSDLADETCKVLEAILGVGNRSWRDYNLFRRIPPVRVKIHEETGEPVPLLLSYEKDPSNTKREALWIRDYVIESLLNWQERGFYPTWPTPPEHALGKGIYELFWEWAESQIEAKRKGASK